MKSPISRIRQFLLGSVAILLALFAQSRLGEGFNTEAIAFYALATILVIVAFRRRTTNQDLPTDTPSEQPAHWLWLGLGLIVIALGLSGFMIWRIDEENPGNEDWAIHLLSLFTLLLGSYFCDPVFVWQRTAANETKAGNQSVQDAWPRWRVPLLLLLIFGIASFFRFFRFDTLPFGTWYDEGEYGMQAMRILNEANFRPIFSGAINGPAHYLYLVAASFDFFGVSTQSLRAVNALLGLLTVVAAYGVGRELFDRRSGLILAFLLAVSGWAVNLSRFGMHSTSTTPLFTVLTVFFLLRALRTRRISDFVWSGFWAGIGLCFYTSFRLFIPSIAVFALYYLIYAWITKVHKIDLRLIAGFFALGLSTLLVIAPLGVFAYRQPDTFWSRIQKTYIFADKAPEERIPVLLESIRKHVLMFNLKGDPNGRHNLPGAPMLDSLTGALFVLGVGLALWRIRRPSSVLLLSWLLLSMLGGILSLDFEAPQSLRSNGVLTAAYILAVLPLYELWQAWERGARPYANALVWPLLLLLAPIGYKNYDFYFNRYANNFSAWNAWSTPETITANLLAKLTPETQAYVISYLAGHPTIRFLLPNAPDYKRIETTESLPLAWPEGKEVELILNQDSRVIYDEAKRYYPNAQFEEIQAPFGSSTVVYRAHLTLDDIASIQGLTARYYSNQDWSGEPTLTLKERVVNTQWPQAAPLPAPFSVEWEGVLRIINYGAYQFFLRAPKNAELYIGEQKVLAGEGELSDGVVLAKGNHNLRLRVRSGEGQISLAWKSPDGEIEPVPSSALYGTPMRVNGLLGRYFANGDWQAPESFAQIDPLLNLYFHNIPLPRPYTVEWSGKIAIPTSGDYGFGLESIDDSTLFINNQELVVANVPNQIFTNQISLGQGFHDIRIRYADRTDHTHINLYWIPPNFAQQPVPAEVLFPPQANYERVTVPGLAELFFSQDAPVPSEESLPSNNTILPAEVAVVAQSLNTPFGMAAGPDGRIYVAETGNSRLLILDSTGAKTGEINTADAPLQEPFDLAIDTTGQLYVQDAATAKISIYDANGNFVRNLAIDPDVAGRARGIFVDSDARIWVARTPGGNVVGLNQEGQSVLNLPLRGDEDSQPVDVAVGVGSNIFVVDGVQNKLIFFTSQGQRLFSWEIAPANTMQSSHLAVDLNGFLYLTEPEKGTVAKLAADGTRLGVYDVRQAGVGKPVGIAVDPAGRIWVSDPERGQVAVITPPEAQQPAAAPPAPTETPVSEEPVQPESPLETVEQPESPLLGED